MRADAQLSQAPECGQPRGAIASPEAVNLRRRLHIDVFILAADDAPQIYAPKDLGGRGVAQLIEGDSDLGTPAAGIAAGPASPDAIPGFIAGAALVGKQRIASGTQRIGTEEKTAAAVAVGIQDDLYIVVFVQGRIPLHPVGDDLVGLGIQAAEAKVEVFVVV